jgi:hypothetical protein
MKSETWSFEGISSGYSGIDPEYYKILKTYKSGFRIGGGDDRMSQVKLSRIQG